MNDDSSFTRIALIGLGLIGGSFAKAARQVGLAPELIGFDLDRETLAQGMMEGVIEQGMSDPRDAVAGADLVVLAAPVTAILSLLPQIAPVLQEGTLVFDLGSTKCEIVTAMGELPPGVRAVGGHPMAGKEVAGYRNAEASLFRGATFALCPTKRTDPIARQQAEHLAHSLGANPLWIDAYEHDNLVATISHLPYLMSIALVRTGLAGGDDRSWQLAASGFRDTSRLAASNERMMRDIIRTNRSAIRTALAIVQGELAALDRALAENDEETLMNLIDAAAKQRRGMFL